jgi:hypothetical protein
LSAPGVAIERVRAALDAHGSRVEWNGSSGKAQCPAPGHEDREPSLSIAQGDSGCVLYCQVGCDTREVVKALGLKWAELFDAPRKVRDKAPRRVVAEYQYTDAAGTLLFVKLRYEPREFKQKCPNGRGGWDWKVPRSIQRPLYRLPEVIEAIKAGHRVWLVEGEKDADRLASLGHVATCNFDGAAKEGYRTKWQPEYGDMLRGADVTIIADRDPAGVAHARAAAADLSGKAKSVSVVQAKVDAKGADVSDHLNAGHGLDDLVPLEDDGPLPARPVVPDGDDEGRGPAQSTVLAALAEERYRLIGSDDGRPYAVRRDGPNIALLLRGKGALRAELAMVYAQQNNGRVPSASALTDALCVLEGRAAGKDQEPVFLRLAHHQGGIVLDLGTSDGRCVVVQGGSWRREARSPVLFRRTNLTSPIPEPIHDGDGLDKLRDLLNTEEKEFRLIVAWLLAGLIPDIPHPILALRGEQGAAKSSTAQMVVNLIDPSPAPLRSVPRDMKSWAVAASASWAVALDNISTIPGWLSDTLCKAVTGDGYVDRVLYSDDDVTVLAFRRAIILTSIDPGALAGDLAERLLVVELQPILDTKRRAEAEIRQSFEESRSAILASLLDLLGHVLAILPELRITRLPRMADFARVLGALDRIQQWDTLGDYLSASTDVAADVVEGDPFAHAITELMKTAGTWEGTATRLLAALATPDQVPKSWPKDATRAGGALKRIAPVLRKLGMEVDESRSRDRNRARLYSITRIDGVASSASAASAASGTRPEQQELADADESASVRNPAASVRARSTSDAADAGPDARDSLAPNASTAPELDKHRHADALDAADAGNHKPTKGVSQSDDPDEAASFWASAGAGDGEWSA